MNHQVRIWKLILVWVVLLSGCAEKKQDPLPKTDPPVETVRNLLKIHDLLKKNPEQRTKKIKNEKVDKSKLSELVADMDARDEFLTDIYLGFVLGTLSRNQEKLVVSEKGNSAEVEAGKAKIILRRKKGTWKIVLEESVPPQIKNRAAEAKKQYDNARVHSS